MSLPIVYLSGTLCTEKLWSEMTEYLGYSGETIIFNLNEKNTIKDMAQDVLQHIEGPFILAGLSLGGIVALQVAAIAPKRVEKLILFNTNPFPPTENQFKSWANNRHFIETQGFENFVTECWAPALAPTNSSLFSAVQDMALEVGQQVYLQQLDAVQTRQNQTTILSSISCNTLVVVGEEDQVCPVAMSRYLSEKIANAKLVILPETGHLSTLEQPKKIANIVKDWLANS
ncbi:alpha/beta fold hydrolase [Metasolibacillus fluoroglycofenilyticus]|uniref:alpha/beta fold hydrolase n=1 Tax=Metasolibacillus fluoroglycofenilyticus TaxID=1239396 RepID=UPI000D352013|nr:alpha/beta hydrolase [Metasolibacillus fluoroglycofenilyticus]